MLKEDPAELQLRQEHPEYAEQQARLPEGCQLWGNYGDGLWRVRTPVSLGLPFGKPTPREAVDSFLVSKRAKEFSPQSF